MVAMAPVPPVRLVRMIALPRCGSTSGVMARDTTSMAPPAPHMMEPARSRVGNCCAVASDTPASIDKAAAAASLVFCISTLESPVDGGRCDGAGRDAKVSAVACGPARSERIVASRVQMSTGPRTHRDVFSTAYVNAASPPVGGVPKTTYRIRMSSRGPQRHLGFRARHGLVEPALVPAGLCFAGSQAQLPVFQLAFSVEQFFGQKSGSGGRKGPQSRNASARSSAI